MLKKKKKNYEDQSLSKKLSTTFSDIESANLIVKCFIFSLAFECCEISEALDINVGLKFRIYDEVIVIPLDS